MGRLEPVMGTEIVDDIRLGHTMEEFRVLNQFVADERPDWFIEVGVHEGGLAYLMLPDVGDGHSIHSFMGYLGIEIDCSIVRPEVKLAFEVNPNAELMCANCFSSRVALKLGELPGMRIIYCDGGNKVKELHHFKHLCKNNDIIMAHDYHDGDRKIHGVEEVHPEVLPMDVYHLDSDESFTRLDENIFKETRIVGWRKNESKKKKDSTT
jgi:hypothetical protein